MTGLVLSLLLLGHEDLELQIARLTEKIRANPADGALHLHRAELHRLHQDAAAARADYRKARSLDPSLARVDLGLGRLELADGRAAAALKHLDAYVEARPDDPSGRLERARAHAALRAWTRAKADYDAALPMLREAAPDVYLERIRIVRAADGHAASMAALDEAVDRFGPVVSLLAEAVEAEVAAERFEEALGRIDRALEVGGRKDRWLLRRGEILERLGRPDEARAAYAVALREIEALPAARRRARETQSLEGVLRSRLRSGEPVSEDKR